MRAPRLEGIYAVGKAAGWKTAWRAVEGPLAPDERVPVLLEFEPAPRVAGRVVDAEGTPLAEVAVRALLGAPAELDAHERRVWEQAHGAAYRVVRTREGLRPVLEHRTSTGADGRFDLPLGGEGEVSVGALLAGHRPASLHLGRVDARARSLALVLEAVPAGTPGHRVLLAPGPEEGAPEAAWGTFEWQAAAQPFPPVVFTWGLGPTDALPAGFLAPGTRYHFSFRESREPYRRGAAEAAPPAPGRDLVLGPPEAGAGPLSCVVHRAE